MAVNIRELAKKVAQDPGISSGHRLCAGCGPAIIMRHLMMARRKPTVVVNATGCVEVATTIFPYTAWKIPWIHNAFENAAATASGVVAARNRLARSGRFAGDPDVEMDYDVIVIGGDGGTYDIGLQSISGAFERGDKFMYVLYDNEAYMNTGIQRSGGTPFGAWTTTTPVGRKIKGKLAPKKPIVDIFVAHKIPYAATVSPAFWVDEIQKFRKGLENMPSFIHAFGVCPRGWRVPENKTIEIAKLAVETCVHPLYEVVEGEYRLTSVSKTIARDPSKKKPISEYLKYQGRFKHLLKPENKELLDELQRQIDKRWEELLKKAGEH